MVLREARRFLRSSPTLSVSAVAVLGLGMGASALMIALLLSFSSLTYEGMRALGYATIAEGSKGGATMPTSWRRFQRLRSSFTGDVGLAAYSTELRSTMGAGATTKPLFVAAVSRGFFSVFTPPLMAGRDFSFAEEKQVGAHVAVLALPLAIRLFEAPEAALNQFVNIGGQPYRVIGVAPKAFSGLFGERVDAWVPAHCVVPLRMGLPAWLVKARPDAWQQLATFYVIAASRRVAGSELAQRVSRSPALRPTAGAALIACQGLTTDPARDAKARRWLRLGLLLTLAFTAAGALNYALLLLARTPRYQDEVRLKRALGAGATRLVAELAAGPAAIVGAGLALSLALLSGGLVFVSRTSPFYAQLVGGSWRWGLAAFGIQIPIACAVTLLAALIPAAGLVRDDGAPRLGYTSTATKRAGSLLQAAVIAQIALCIATWILAGMVVPAVASLAREPLGYDPTRLNVVSIGPASGTVSFSGDGNDSFPPLSAVRGLIESVDAIPGVRSASFASSAPFGSPPDTLKVRPADDPSMKPLAVTVVHISPGYFRSLGTRILRGSEFSWRGSAEGGTQVIVNRALAKELWTDEDPIGHAINILHPAFAGMPAFTSEGVVTGVVENEHFSGPAGPSRPSVFQPLKGSFLVTSYLLVSGSEPVLELRDTARSLVATRMPGLAAGGFYSVGSRVRAARWKLEQRAYLALGGAISMALVACIGLYGALAFLVNTARREMAVRVCLGATPWDLRKIVLWRAARCVLLAALVSAPLWVGLARLSSHGYLGPASWSLGRAALLTLGCAAISLVVSLSPAAAAARVPPAEALREP